MRNKITKQIIFIYCVITFSLLGTPIVFSQGQVSDTSDLEKELEQKSEELTQAAKNIAIKKLENIEDFLSKGGWDIDTEDWKIIPVSEEIREKIAEIQTGIKDLFIATALSIEEEENIEIKVDNSGIGLSKKEAEKRNKMFESNKDSTTTIRSRAMAIKVLYRINEDLIAVAKQEEDPKKKSNMYLTQAVFVYELSSIIMGMIDNLSATSIEDLRNIYKDQMEEISNMETEAKKMVEKNENDQQAKDWLGALDVLREKWNIFLSTLGKQEDWIKKLKDSKEKFEGIAKKAVYQIKMLEMKTFVEELSEEIEGIVSVLEIENIEILPLGRDDINALFAVQPMGKDFEDKSIKLKAQ
jgi:hypothetical protein